MLYRKNMKKKWYPLLSKQLFVFAVEPGHIYIQYKTNNEERKPSTLLTDILEFFEEFEWFTDDRFDAMDGKFLDDPAPVVFC